MSRAKVAPGQCEGCGWLQRGANCAVFWKRSEAWIDEDGECEAKRTPEEAAEIKRQMAEYAGEAGQECG